MTIPGCLHPASSSAPASLRTWVARLRGSYRCDIGRIRFARSKDWAFEDGALRHRTGRFFSIRAYARDGECARPLIDQPEIGILGIALRESAGGTEILCHAKAEPGNTHIIQLAPSFQATRSNFECLHGGGRQVLHDWFVGSGAGTLVSESLQTETSEAFFRKRNANVVRLLSPEESERVRLTPYLRWYPLAEALDTIEDPFLFNTDARSVLACTGWDRIAPHGRPFRRGRDARLEALLAESFQLLDSPSFFDRDGVARWTAALRAKPRSRVTPVRLEDATGWRLVPDCIAGSEASRYSIAQIAVEMPGRERERWDQPILADSGEGCVVLVCSVIGGVLHFLVCADSALGSYHGFDLNALQADPRQGPAVCRTRRWLARIRSLQQAGAARTLACSRFSDEGGRFFHAVSRYEVVLVPAGALDPTPEDDAAWLTLGQLKSLIAGGELVSSELRSALSLLLRYL